MKNVTALALAGLFVSAGAFAQDEAPPSPLYHGAYVAPMGSYTLTDNRWHTDDGVGGLLDLGYRFDSIAIELSGLYSKLGGKHGASDTKLTNLGANVLYFPFESARGLYVIGGGGHNDTKNYVREADDDFSAQYLHAGLGNLFGISIGRYDFAIRAEALARHTQRQHQDTNGDEPRWFHDFEFNVGLQLPFGLREAPPAPAPEAAPEIAVVPPVAVCADNQDNDGDGQVDFPNDPGCSAADDADETDPVQCSDGKDNDGDGQVDFPADKGCTAADDNDEEDPCKAPAPGETVSLKGCGTGDVIVLRGVNFDYDRAHLTRNAQTILDEVSGELAAYPDINVEIGGHTDAKGSDEYNQKLSERRAQSVRQYLIGKGIAAERMTSVGYGETQPVADNETDEGRELNRRVELKITAGGGAASSAAPADAAPAAATP